MKKNRWFSGWTRIGEQEFKQLAKEAISKDPQMKGAIHQALTANALENRVPRETLNRYLGWLSEIPSIWDIAEGNI